MEQHPGTTRKVLQSSRMIMDDPCWKMSWGHTRKNAAAEWHHLRILVAACIASVSRKKNILAFSTLRIKFLPASARSTSSGAFLAVLPVAPALGLIIPSFFHCFSAEIDSRDAWGFKKKSTEVLVEIKRNKEVQKRKQVEKRITKTSNVVPALWHAGSHAVRPCRARNGDLWSWESPGIFGTSPGFKKKKKKLSAGQAESRVSCCDQIMNWATSLLLLILCLSTCSQSMKLCSSPLNTAKTCKNHS